MGYASRLLAESWDSNNLYWARLADEKGYSPVMLNLLVPELTRRMVEKIFASHFEDWPALLNAMHETGDDFRQGKVASLTASALARICLGRFGATPSCVYQYLTFIGITRVR